MKKRRDVLAVILTGALVLGLPISTGAEAAVTAADTELMLEGTILDGEADPEETLLPDVEEDPDTETQEIIPETDVPQVYSETGSENPLQIDEYVSDDGDEIETESTSVTSEWVGDPYDEPSQTENAAAVESQPEEAEDEAEAPTEGSCGDHAAWMFQPESGVLTVTGEGPMDTFSENEPAPWQSYAEEIRVMEVGEGITSLSSYALCGQRNLTTLKLPSSLTEIGDNAFVGCSEEITILM